MKLTPENCVGARVCYLAPNNRKVRYGTVARYEPRGIFLSHYAIDLDCGESRLPLQNQFEDAEHRAWFTAEERVDMLHAELAAAETEVRAGAEMRAERSKKSERKTE